MRESGNESDGENALDADVWDDIHRQTAGQGLGDGQKVVCADCGRVIEQGDRAKGYLVGRRGQWRIARVLHPDCSEIIVEDRIGDTDEQEAIVYGTIAFAPAVARQAADDRAASKREMEAIFGDDLSVIKASLPRHHLTDVELGTAHLTEYGTVTTVAGGT